MPSASEVREQVARESEQRRRLAVPAFAGGLLYLLSGIIVSASLSGAPTVGMLEGLAAALRGAAGAARRSEPAREPARAGGEIHQPPRADADSGQRRGRDFDRGADAGAVSD